jgi:hypothetical protein
MAWWKGCLIASGVIVGLGLVVLVGCALLLGRAAQQSKTAADRLPVGNITWAQVAQTLMTNRQLTDIQRDELWKPMDGQKVKWTGTVVEVDSMLGQISVKVLMQQRAVPGVATHDVSLSLDDKQRDQALRLKKGQPITFTGVLGSRVLTTVSLSHGELLN